MKRNFKVIKQDKNLSHLSDADIEKLYSTYIEMDGKHQNFKGSKREYCSIISGMIKNWLKSVNKNGLSGGKGTRKGIIKKKIPIEKDIEKISEKVKDLSGKIDEANNFIAKTYANNKKKIATANNPKITKTKKEIEDIQKNIPKAQEDVTDLQKKISELREYLKPIPNADIQGALRGINGAKAQREIFVKGDPEMIKKIFVNSKQYSPDIYRAGKQKLKHPDVPYSPYAYGAPYTKAGIKGIIADYDELLSQFEEEYKELIENPDNYDTLTPSEIKKTNLDISKLEKQLPIKQKALNDLEGSVKPLEVLLASQEENKETALSKLEGLKSKAEQDKVKYGNMITVLLRKKETKEGEFPGIEEEAEEYLKSKKEKFDKEFGSYATGLPSRETVELEDAYKYRRVLEYLSQIGDSGESFIAIQNFFMALPYPKILDVDNEGEIQRKKFVAKISQYPRHQINYANQGESERFEWTPEMEKSFRSEYFVFWTCLAKNFDNKETIVDNVKLAGKIFSKLLLEDPVDYSLKYFTGDSKGVTTSAVEKANGKLYASSAVVTLRKIFVILSESAVIERGAIAKFNDPNLIFTYYRDTPGMMSGYSQDKRKFSGKVPYELLLKYSLNKLVISASDETRKELFAKIVECQSLDYEDKRREYSNPTTLNIVDKLIKDHYKTTTVNHNELIGIANGKRTLFLPVGTDYKPGTPKYTLTNEIFTKAKSDLEVIGYSEVLFPDGKPTIDDYSRLYTSKNSKVINYTGSFIDDFHYDPIVDDAVITDVRDGDGEDLGGTIGDDDLSEEKLLKEYEDSDITGVSTSGVVVPVTDSPATGTTPPEGVALRAGPGVGDVSDAEMRAKIASEGRGKPQKGSGKPKAYIKKIIKYYQ